jgi:hypothetical protein
VEDVSLRNTSVGVGNLIIDIEISPQIVTYVTLAAPGSVELGSVPRWELEYIIDSRNTKASYGKYGRGHANTSYHYAYMG